MKQRGKKLLYLTIITLVVTVSALGCAGLFQHRLIFFPDRLDKDEDLSWTGASEEVFVTTEDGARIHGLFFEAPRKSRGVVLYFHGNAGSVASWYQVALRLNHHDVDVFLVDYRTYGKSRGDLSEQGLYFDGEATYQYLIDRGYAPEEIVVHGRSLGGAVATWVTKKYPVGGLILETPFTDLPSLARDLYRIGLPQRLFRFRFDNLSRASDIDAPTWVVHGTEDGIVPLEHGRQVYEELPEAWKFTVIDGGGHNDLMSFEEYSRDLISFYDLVLAP